MRFTPAQQQYNRRVMILMIVYAAVLFGVVSWFVHAPPRGALGVAAAVLPALPLVAVFASFGRYLADETDEYVRMLLVRQSLIATGLLLCASTIWGFLEGFDLAPHILAYWWPTVWLFGLGLGGCVNLIVHRRVR